MTQLTWEQACGLVGNEIQASPGQALGDSLFAVEMLINDLKREVGRGSYLQLGAIALTVYSVLKDTERWDAVQQLVVPTVCGKQNDYGPQNILWGGHPGIVLRMHDKVARLMNLIATGGTAANEPVSDSWLDLVGYSIVGIMLIDGSFEYPLKRDVGAVPTDATADATGDPDPLTELMQDPTLKAAYDAFDNEQATTTSVIGVLEDGTKIIKTAEPTRSLVVLWQDEGHWLALATGSSGPGVQILASDPIGMVCNTVQLATFLNIAGKAAESGLGWRNTKLTAEVPND